MFDIGNFFLLNSDKYFFLLLIFEQEIYSLPVSVLKRFCINLKKIALLVFNFSFLFTRSSILIHTLDAPHRQHEKKKISFSSTVITPWSSSFKILRNFGGSSTDPVTWCTDNFYHRLDICKQTHPVPSMILISLPGDKISKTCKVENCLTQSLETLTAL